MKLIKKLKSWLESDKMTAWVCPIPMARLEITMRNMCGKGCFWLTAWYNINLLIFKVLGSLKILGKRQEFYDMCIKHNEVLKK